MEPKIYITLTFSSDNDENSSLSYRRLHLPVNKAREVVEYICKNFGHQTESLPKAFDALFSDIKVVENPLLVEKPSRNDLF